MHRHISTHIIPLLPPVSVMEQGWRLSLLCVGSDCSHLSIISDRPCGKTCETGGRRPQPCVVLLSPVETSAPSIRLVCHSFFLFFFINICLIRLALPWKTRPPMSPSLWRLWPSCWQNLMCRMNAVYTGESLTWNSFPSYFGDEALSETSPYAACHGCVRYAIQCTRFKLEKKQSTTLSPRLFILL